ncbi:MAG: hypothetical protein M1829_005126 [Trizodia sp. TS-e1964]|nr:MAG: hypothetical protein M1829_005126 [Trizodia sp. TS-e1964]
MSGSVGNKNANRWRVERPFAIAKKRTLHTAPGSSYGDPYPPTRSTGLLKNISNSERLSPVRKTRQPRNMSNTLSFGAYLPSFMSVYEDANMTGTRDGDALENQLSNRADVASCTSSEPVPVGVNHYKPQHQHRESTSTSNSDSTDSSPTTTISTIDSATMTDPSPGSSPASPVKIVPLSSFCSRNIGMLGLEDLAMGPPPSPPTGYNRPLSPGKKPRNMKNLSLNMNSRHAPFPPRLQVRTASMVESSTAINSAPPSPSFIVPPKPPKRKPSMLGLSIKTPALSSLSQRGPGGLSIVPSTPAANRPAILRHHQSSPSLSLFSPSLEVKGGMQLLSLSFNQRLAGNRTRQPPSLLHKSSFDSIPTISEQASPALSSRLGELEEETYDPPLSQEVKSPAYPSGPVCIYDPNVYLYLEPDDDEASKFDVIINVAREVRNPFELAAEQKKKNEAAGLNGEADASGIRDIELKHFIAPEPEITTLTSTASSISASPTTPRASLSKSDPEYIHIPWDHNTNIVDDLMVLVERIDERVRQGKRVLVHCQCGVSRSASLIVAYGLYKNPSLSVQEAYDAVKARSRWIGPNMSLIYQLSEFRTKLLAKSGISQPGFRPWRGSGISTGRANTIASGSPTHRPSLSLDMFDSLKKEPQTAPLPTDRDRTL